MADHSTRTLTETVTRHEWLLTTPTNWVELDKMLASVKHYAEEHGLRFNDSLTVELDDSDIIIVHEVRTDV